jgi:broad specificity phosphatase PhoE
MEGFSDSLSYPVLLITKTAQGAIGPRGRRVNWYFVRHGEIAANIRKIYAGQSHERLTEKGRGQALEMADKLMNCDITEIYCSPVARALETAEIIGAILGKRPILAEAFKELALGPWESKSETEVQQDFPVEWQGWNNRPAELVLVGRETLGELLRRVLKGLKAIQAQNSHRSVLVVTHVAIIRVLLLHWQALELNLYKQISIPHGKIFHLKGLVNSLQASPRRLPD